MEKEHQQWIVHEEEEVEVEDAALERRKFLPQSKDNLVTSVVVSSSPAGNGGMHNNGVCSVATDPDSSPVQKEDEVAEIDIVGENGIRFKDDKVDHAAVGFGLVAEFVGAGAAVSQNKSSVYFDKQQDNEVNGLNGVQNGDGARSVCPTNHGEIEFDVQVENSVIENSLCNEVNNQLMKTVDDKVTSSSELSSLHDSSAIQATAVTNLDDEACTEEGLNLIEEIDQQLDVETVLAKQETHDLFCPNCNSCITKRVLLKKRKRNIHNLDNEAKRDKLDTIVSSNLIDSSPHDANQADQASAMSNISLEIPADNYDHEREPEVFRCLSCFSFFILTGKGFNLFRNFGGAREHETSRNPSSIPVSNLQNPSNLPSSNTNWLFSLFTSTKGKTAGESSLEHSTTGPSEHHHSTSITSTMQTSTEIGHLEGPLSDTAKIKNVKPTSNVNHGHGGLNSLISSAAKSVKIEAWMENDIKSNMAGKEPLADQKCLDSLFQYDLSSLQSCKKSAGDEMNGLQRVEEDFIDFSAETLLTVNVRTNEGEKNNDSTDIINTNNVEDMSSMSFSDEMLSKLENVQLASAATTEILVNDGEPAKDATLNSYEGEPQFRVPTTAKSPILENSQKDVDKTPEIVQSSYSSLKQGAQSPVLSLGDTVLASDVASNKQGSGIGDAIIPKKHDLTLTETLQKDVAEEINPSVGKENEGTDVIVSIEGEAFESTTSQAADNAPYEEGTIMTESRIQVSIGEKPRAEIGERPEWEILKSIVYGGLIESITSLGIVSSAAGSGAAPLNIIALGLANLVGGLFILAHNLVELRNDHSRGDQQQTNTQDRYEELLGRRRNIMFHAVVAILSFLIFGSAPLVIYGLLINKNYYAEVKLAAVAATSVVCIIMLAIGKVCTKRPPKSYIKTVVYYVTLALAASGVSYIGGNLIKDLLEKFSHSGFVTVMPISDTSTEPAWMSY